MSNLVSFDQLKERLAPNLEEIEAWRKRIIKKGWIISTIATTFFTLIIASTIVMMDEPGILIGIVAFIWIIVVIIGFSPTKELRQYYKSHIIKPFVEALFDNGQYKPYSGISQATFELTGIFRTPDRYSSEDLMYGNIGKTAVQFSEVHAEEKTRDKDGKEQFHTIFRGFLFIADFHKSFEKSTYVLKDSFKSKRLRVRLEDPEFDKKFKVYCEDQIEARYILSPSLMRRVVELDKKFGGNLQISFVNSQVCAAIKSKRNYFECSVRKSIHSPGLLKSEYDMISSLVSIVDDLNLNTRIWSKD